MNAVSLHYQFSARIAFDDNSYQSNVNVYLSHLSICSIAYTSRKSERQVCNLK